MEQQNQELELTTLKSCSRGLEDVLYSQSEETLLLSVWRQLSWPVSRQLSWPVGGLLLLEPALASWCAFR